MSKSITRTQPVKVHISPNHVELYNDLQDDFRKVITFLFNFIKCGYVVHEDDVHEDDDKDKSYKIISPEECLKNREKFPPELIQWADVVIRGGKNGENSYGVFTKKYEGLNRPKKNSFVYKSIIDENIKDEWKQYRKDFLSGKPMNCFFHDNEDRKPLIEYVKTGKEPKLTEELSNYRKRIKNGESLEGVLDEIGGTELSKCVTSIRNGDVSKILPVTRRNNKSYCQGLMHMVSSAMSSWSKCHENHQKDRDNLSDVIKQRINKEPETFELLLSFSKQLKDNNYGVTSKVLNACLKGKDFDDFYAIAIAVARREEFSKLWKNERSLFFAYKTLRMYEKLQNGKPFISKLRSNSDYHVPFALTGRGSKFIAKNDGDTLIFITPEGEIRSERSHYYANLTVENGKNCFYLNFNHKLKDYKKDIFGPEIKAILKEIHLLKQNGCYYMYLPHSIEKDEINFKIEDFFNTADKRKCDKKRSDLPSQMRVGGFDINLSVPLTVATATFKKDSAKGNLYALDYGSGYLEKNEILCGNSSLSRLMRDLSNKYKTLTKVIREFKVAKKNKTDITKESNEWMMGLLGDKFSGSSRYKIQSVMVKLGERSSEYKFRCRNNGHNNLSESVSLLRLLDAEFSLKCCYDNIHVDNKEKWVKSKKTNNIRENFRDFVSKQYASQIVKAAVGNKLNIAFIEDLELDADRDSDLNSLSRLLAAGQLKHCIEVALQNAGIGCVFVPPALTSKTDPVSGLIGFRPKGKDEFKIGSKENLYSLDSNNNLYRHHADLIAAVNVMLVGLGHSIFPHFGIVKKGRLSSKETAKRLPRFIEERGILVGDLPEGKVYFTPDGAITEEEKKAREEKIKHLVLKSKEIPLIDLSSSVVESYNAFSVKRSLIVQPIVTKAVTTNDIDDEQRATA